MEASRPLDRWLIALRLVVAAILCFCFLALTLPDISPGGAGAKSFWIALSLTPFALISFGAIRQHGMEVFGWALVSILLLLRGMT